MSKPTKTPAIRPSKLLNKPADLVVDVLPIRSLGEIIARERQLPSGMYELVIEYKIGTAPLAEPDGNSFPGIGVALGGVGLRKSDKQGPMTIVIA